MRVVDTSAWIEWLIGSALGKRLASDFPAQNEWLVPTLVQLELSKWLLREADADRADSVIARTMQCVVVPMNTGIALLAAELHQRHRLATADAIVYATAQLHGADLLTCDAHFEGLPGVVFHRKRG
jgi:predicted nucleic acid-binding protein